MAYTALKQTWACDAFSCCCRGLRYVCAAQKTKCCQIPGFLDITRFLGATPCLTNESLRQVSRLCSKCGQGCKADTRRGTCCLSGLVTRCTSRCWQIQCFGSEVANSPFLYSCICWLSLWWSAHLSLLYLWFLEDAERLNMGNKFRRACMHPQYIVRKDFWRTVEVFPQSTGVFFGSDWAHTSFFVFLFLCFVQ